MHSSRFQAHLSVAHRYWQQFIKPGDYVIDATCGNGHDSLLLAQLALTEGAGKLLACDIQQEAMDKTKHLLSQHLSPKIYQRVSFFHGCHSQFPPEIVKNSVKLIVYNLGYLPGGDKSFTTQLDTTLKSVNQAQELISDDGLISITCYPGHPEGKREEEALLEYAASLDPKKWQCSHQRWVNRQNAPSLLFIMPLPE